MPIFKDKQFCSKVGIPADWNLTIDQLPNALIQVKKYSDRDFHTHNGNITNDDHNHCVEVPRGNYAPISRALAKSASNMMIDSSGKSSWSSKVVKSLERECPIFF